MNVNKPKHVIEKFEKLLISTLGNNAPTLVKIEEAITLCSLTLLDLKEIISTKEFVNKNEEIYFFKHIKARVYSKFIYYSKLYRIICRRPVSTKQIQTKYFIGHLESIEKYFQDNFEFWQYHKRGLTFLDEKFYTRENAEIPPNMDNLHFLIDKTFSTMQDHTLSTLMANEMLVEYIKAELFKLEQPDSTIPQTKNGIFSNFQWTGSKTALIELIYALYSSKSINSGKVDLKEMVKVFEKVFNIELGDFYRTFVEIRNRKIERTKFIDNLKQSLINRMDEADAK